MVVNSWQRDHLSAVDTQLLILEAYEKEQVMRALPSAGLKRSSMHRRWPVARPVLLDERERAFMRRREGRSQPSYAA